MDLLEVEDGAARHPWELSRARAVERIARRHGPGAVRSILDWGCGDAFTGRALLERLGAERLVGVDPHLTEAQQASFAAGDPRVVLTRDPDSLAEQRFDLVLLCDVIEHVENDAELVSSVTARFLSPGGRLIVTVPAFQSLFTVHDVALKHFRRYRLSELESVIERANLRLLGSGYLFGSLLPARAAAKLFEGPPRTGDSIEPVGLGGWRRGRLATGLVEGVLSADNSLLLFLAERGLKLPGLSAWASCERPGS